jgi:glucosamine-6-phosphate deaminase
MKVIRAKNFDEMSQIAGDIFAAQVNEDKHSVLGLATGGTVVNVYAVLAEEYAKGNLDFSHIQTVNLDEYAGLDPTHPQSYRYYMEDNFFKKVNLKSENTHLPLGLAQDLEEECHRYEDLIKSLGGIDLQLLGLGKNGHIGFNEPGPTFEKDTHYVELEEGTRIANARFFDRLEDVPGKAITMGIGSIMGAKKIVLCVSGSEKAEILKAVLEGPITPFVPGSILQIHPDLTVVADEDALAMLA